MQKTTLYLDPYDREMLALVRAQHGLTSDSAAVRFSIREQGRLAGRELRRRERAERQAEKQEEGQGE